MTRNSVEPRTRLMNLVVALISTRRGLTKGELFASLAGYVGESGDSLERKFERDKRQLRELGIPLETIPDEHEPENNQLARYRISKAAYDQPDPGFTPEELTLIGMATRLWLEHASGEVARRALTKIRSFGHETHTELLERPPRVVVSEPYLLQLGAAMRDRSLATFDYLTPGRQAPMTRHIVPDAVFPRDGRWFMHGWDLDRAAHRTFLLSRMSRLQPATEIPEGTHVPDPVPLAQITRELDEIWAAQEAILVVAPDSEAATRLGPRLEQDPHDPSRFRVHYLDRVLFAEELAGYGPEVRVIAPLDLVGLVTERLEWLVAHHTAQLAIGEG